MSLGEELRQLLSSDAIADDPETLAAHSGDKWFATEAPEVVVFARSTSDISKLLKFASQKKIAVTARGAGFGYVGGCVPAKKGIALSLMQMNRIKEINFADAIAIVEPGIAEKRQLIVRQAWIFGERVNLGIRLVGVEVSLHRLIESGENLARKIGRRAVPDITGEIHHQAKQDDQHGDGGEHFEKREAC